MRLVIYVKRCINSISMHLNRDTCIVTNTILKLGFVAKRMKQLLLLRKFSTSLVMQQETEINKTVWDPLYIFHCPSHYKYALIILNRPIFWKPDVFLQIWEKAQITITVDGGTHRWVKYMEDQGFDLFNGKNNKYLPDVITGDMDSASPLMIEKLKSMGTEVIETPDQSHTDYTKALLQLAELSTIKNINISGIYVFAETSGRFDHIIANVNTLYKSDKLVGSVQVIQVASNSLTWLLKPGIHKIYIPEILVQNNNWCGLLPFGTSVKHISTTGLKWNLDNTCLEFGGLVSSSNTYDKNCTEVTVNTDTPVIWTMGIESLRGTVNSQETLTSNM